MEKKRSEFSPFLLIVGVGVLLFLAVAGYFLITFLNNSKASKPEIVLIQPTIPQTIENTQGFLFVVQATDEKGIQRIEFLENGLPKGRAYPPNAGMTELLSQIVWIPDGIGIYELSFIAYDQENTASDPAAITIGVISPGLSQADVDEIETEVASSIPNNTAPEGASSGDEGAGGDSGNQNALQEDVENASGDENNAPDDEMEFIQVQGGAQDIRPVNSDQPPEITDFETGIQREGDGIRVNVHVMVQDDVGVSTIIVVDHMENNNQEIPIQIEHDCLDETSCALTTSELLGPGNHSMVILAVDTLGQLSRPNYKDIEILPNLHVNEGPAVVEEAEGLQVPIGLLNGMQLHAGGLFGIAPFVNIGWIDVEEPEEGVIGLIDDCPPDCPETSFDDVRVEVVNQYYDMDSIYKMDVRMIIPPHMETDYEVPWLASQVYVDSNTYHTPTYFSEDVYENGKTIANTISEKYCGLGDLQFFPILRTQDHDKFLGTPTAFTSLPCSVNPTIFLQMRATQNCANSDYCLITTWEVTHRDNLEHLPIDHFMLIEKIYDGRRVVENEIILPAQETTYVNTDVLRGRVYEYIITAVSAEGIHSRQHKINIRVPGLNVSDTERTSEFWQEVR